MNTIIRTIMLLTIVALWVIPLQAQVGLEKVAQSTMNFLLVDVSPRSSAMGGAACALSRGAEGVLFNPAALPESDHRLDMRVFTTQWIADINYMVSILTYNSDRLGSIGISLLNVDYGNLKGTSLLSSNETTLYPHGYRETGNFSAGAYAIGLSYARAISAQFLIGGTAKITGQSLGQSTLAGGVKDNDVNKMVFDAGVKYYTFNRNLWLAMSIRNFSSNIIRETIAEQMPLLFTMGIAFDVFDFFMPKNEFNQDLLLSIDFQHPNNYTERTAVGLEYNPIRNLFIRCGYYTNHDLANWSAGMGLNVDVAGKPIQFDYSYSNMEVFKGVNRFSIGFSF